MPLTLADEVGALEIKCQRTLDLCGEVLATLELNKQHFFRDDQPAEEVFFDLLEKWKKRLNGEQP